MHMHLPDSVEPFVETEPERFAVTIVVLVTLGLALLSEAEGGIAAYPIAAAVGTAAVWALRRRDTVIPAPSADHGGRLPVFLRFDDRRVVVVGGGAVAAAKLPALLAAGGRVSVIAPSIADEIRAQPVTLIERRFEPSDLDGAWFVTAAATAEVNRAVRDAADARGIFVNAVDDPSNASAYLGGTVVRGGVTVAFSTAGRAPALAGLLREAFEVLLPDDLDRWAERAHQLSVRQRRERVPIGSRRPQLLQTLNELYDERQAGRS
jgi:siroheme synthase-like protein